MRSWPHCYPAAISPTVSRASIAIFTAPFAEEQPPLCEILAAWNRETDLPNFVGERLTLEETGLLPPYLHDKPIVIENVQTKKEFPRNVRHRFELLKTRSLIIFPLIARGAWYGVLSLHFQQRRAIKVDDLRHIRGLVDQTAIAIDNIRLLAAEAKARHEAEQANDLKLKFLAMISHELRTPLTSIKGFATTLLADDVQWHPANQHDFLRTIDEEADKLGDLIEQLLDLSRLEAGTLRIAPKPQTLEHVIATALAQLQTMTVNHQLIAERAARPAAHPRRCGTHQPGADQSRRQCRPVFAGPDDDYGCRTARGQHGSDRRDRSRSGHTAAGADADL